MADKIMEFIAKIEAWFKLIMNEVKKAIDGAKDHDTTLGIEDEAE